MLIFGGLDVSSDARSLLSSLPHRLSQRRDGPEGVGGEAQAAAAGVCTEGEHLGHAAGHEGAGNARVHCMYLFLYFWSAD